MVEIWSILGIDPPAGVDEIRAAYAQRVKECHPEDDPEGFMRLREAYKMAVRMASAGGGRTAPAPQAAAPAVQLAEPGGAEPGRAPENTGAQAPAFDFSLAGQGQAPGAGKAPEPSFDFSALERDAAANAEREKQHIDGLFAWAMVLYSTRGRKKKAAWQALFADPEIETLKRREAFTWAFLDFLAMTPEIPTGVRRQVLDPLAEELRTYWRGTLLWDEFELATQKYTSKGLEKSFEFFRTQLVSLVLAITVLPFVVSKAMPLLRPANAGGATGLLEALRFAEISGVACLATAIVFGISSQVFGLVRISAVVNRGVSGRARISSSRFLLVLACVLGLLFGSVALRRIPVISRYTADLRQIDEGRPAESVVYVYRNIRRGDSADTINAVATDRSDPLYGRLTVPGDLYFHPEELALLNDNLSIEANLANGMRAYKITYTDNFRVVVSIAEVL